MWLLMLSSTARGLDAEQRGCRADVRQGKQSLLYPDALSGRVVFAKPFQIWLGALLDIFLGSQQHPGCLCANVPICTPCRRSPLGSTAADLTLFRAHHALTLTSSSSGVSLM